VTDELSARRPDLAEPLHELCATLLAGPVETELLDACEALIRRRLGVPVATPAPDPGDPQLDGRARSVLLVAEQFVVDPHGIDDRMRDQMLDHCSLAELATLMTAFAVFDALARLEAVLG
jgi:hypothetical protein